MQKKTESPQTQRLDQWLHCARFFKTRNAATNAIKYGRVLVDGLRTKPSKSIRPGSLLTIRNFKKNQILTVLGLQWKRLAPKEARSLYQEKIQVPVNDMLEDELTPVKNATKPNKRERRQLNGLKRALKSNSYNSRLG